MFLQAPHKKLQLVTTSKKLVEQCYEITNALSEERNDIIQHIRKSVLATYLCICEASYQSKKQKRKSYKKALTQLMVADAAFEILIESGTVKQDQLANLPGLFLYIYEQLNQLIEAA
jgi:hypothetical protein